MRLSIRAMLSLIKPVSALSTAIEVSCWRSVRTSAFRSLMSCLLLAISPWALDAAWNRRQAAERPAFVVYDYPVPKL